MCGECLRPLEKSRLCGAANACRPVSTSTHSRCSSCVSRDTTSNLIRGARGKGCGVGAYKGYLALHLGEMRKLAAMHGGVCVSDDYSGLSKPLQWRCDQGHL